MEEFMNDMAASHQGELPDVWGALASSVFLYS